MKSTKILLTIIMAVVFVTGGFSKPNATLGNDIAKKNHAQPKFQKVKGNIVFKIYGKDGKVKFTKTMVMAQYIQNMGTANEVTRSISTFKAPADDQGNSYMAYTFRNKADVKYVYLKGIKKAKKVAGATRKSSFFGSDFANCDMGYPVLSEYKFNHLGKEKLTFKGKKLDCDIIEMLPKNNNIKNELGYGRKVSYIYKVNNNSYLTIRMDFFDTNMKKFKEQYLTSFIAKKNNKGQLVVFTTGLLMKNLRTGTKTEFNLSNLEFDDKANVRPEIFSVQWLSRKWW